MIIEMIPTEIGEGGGIDLQPLGPVLRQAVARRLERDVPGYRVGGKTGTAEVATGGGYSKKANVSTFAAAFPMDAPRYVVIVMLDSPIGAVTTAAYTAAPVVSRFILRAGPMLGVVPNARRDVDVSDLMPLIWRRPGEKPQASADPE